MTTIDRPSDRDVRIRSRCVVGIDRRVSAKRHVARQRCRTSRVASVRVDARVKIDGLCGHRQVACDSAGSQRQCCAKRDRVVFRSAVDRQRGAIGSIDAVDRQRIVARASVDRQRAAWVVERHTLAERRVDCHPQRISRIDQRDRLGTAVEIEGASRHIHVVIDRLQARVGDRMSRRTRFGNGDRSVRVVREVVIDRSDRNRTVIIEGDLVAGSALRAAVVSDRVREEAVRRTVIDDEVVIAVACVEHNCGRTRHLNHRA